MPIKLLSTQLNSPSLLLSLSPSLPLSFSPSLLLSLSPSRPLSFSPYLLLSLSPSLPLSFSPYLLLSLSPALLLSFSPSLLLSLSPSLPLSFSPSLLLSLSPSLPLSFSPSLLLALSPSLPLSFSPSLLLSLSPSLPLSFSPSLLLSLSPSLPLSFSPSLLLSLSPSLPLSFSPSLLLSLPPSLSLSLPPSLRPSLLPSLPLYPLSLPPSLLPSLLLSCAPTSSSPLEVLTSLTESPLFTYISPSSSSLRSISRTDRRLERSLVRFWIRPCLVCASVFVSAYILFWVTWTVAGGSGFFFCVGAARGLAPSWSILNNSASDARRVMRLGAGAADSCSGCSRAALGQVPSVLFGSRVRRERLSSPGESSRVGCVRLRGSSSEGAFSAFLWALRLQEGAAASLWSWSSLEESLKLNVLLVLLGFSGSRFSFLVGLRSRWNLPLSGSSRFVVLPTRITNFDATAGAGFSLPFSSKNFSFRSLMSRSSLRILRLSSIFLVDSNWDERTQNHWDSFTFRAVGWSSLRNSLGYAERSESFRQRYQTFIVLLRNTSTQQNVRDPCARLFSFLASVAGWWVVFISPPIKWNYRFVILEDSKYDNGFGVGHPTWGRTTCSPSERPLVSISGDKFRHISDSCKHANQDLGTQYNALLTHSCQDNGIHLRYYHY